MDSLLNHSQKTSPNFLHPINGVLLINKQSGPTSYDMIRCLKRVIGKQKIGHAGTLDPLASGLLIILIGKFTKRQSEFMMKPKVYRCTMKWGILTDTGDITGKTIREGSIPKMTNDEKRILLNSFVGTQQQIPPMYSACKIKGKKLYELARKGIEVERRPREIQIYSIELLSENNDEWELRVKCSSGTYVRVLMEDIAAKINNVATMSHLVRESVGSFSFMDALPGEKIDQCSVTDISARLIS